MYSGSVGHTVDFQVTFQGIYSCRVPFTSVEMFSFGVDKVGYGKVTNTWKEMEEVQNFTFKPVLPVDFFFFFLANKPVLQAEFFFKQT